MRVVVLSFFLMVSAPATVHADSGFRCNSGRLVTVDDRMYEVMDRCGGPDLVGQRVAGRQVGDDAGGTAGSAAGGTTAARSGGESGSTGKSRPDGSAGHGGSSADGTTGGGGNGIDGGAVIGGAAVPSKGCGKTDGVKTLTTGGSSVSGAPTTSTRLKGGTSGGKGRAVIIDIPEDYDPSKPYRLVFSSDGTCPWGDESRGGKACVLQHAKDNGCTVPSTFPDGDGGQQEVRLLRLRRMQAGLSGQGVHLRWPAHPVERG